MNKLVLAVALLGLQGCIYQTVNRADLTVANEICKEHGGILEIVSYLGGKETVTCLDGTTAGSLTRRSKE